MATVDTSVNELIINKLTQAQYDALTEKSPAELYFVTDAKEPLQVVDTVENFPACTVEDLGKLVLYTGPTTDSTKESVQLILDSKIINGHIFGVVEQTIAISETESETIYMWKDVYESLPTIEDSVTGKVLSNNGLYPEWVEIDSGLPDQTGQSGKFLTTDGTDASWSDKPLVNVSTQNGSLVIGSGSQSLVVDTTAYGVNTIGFGRYASAFGKSAVAKYKATALGANSIANEYTIQLGQGGTNSDAGTMKVALTTSSDVTTNYELLSADGTVPTARLTKVNTTITLTAAGWSNSSQTVNVTGMTADGVVFVNPTPANQSAYTSAGILCTAQAAGSLTFTCDTVPSADITVTVVML